MKAKESIWQDNPDQKISPVWLSNTKPKAQGQQSLKTTKNPKYIYETQFSLEAHMYYGMRFGIVILWMHEYA